MHEVIARIERETLYLRGIIEGFNMSKRIVEEIIERGTEVPEYTEPVELVEAEQVEADPGTEIKL